MTVFGLSRVAYLIVLGALFVIALWLINWGTKADDKAKRRD